MKQTSRFSGVQKVLSQIKGSQAGRLLLIVAASVLMALNIKSFVNAGGLFPGGFNGLTLLIQRSAAQFAGIDLPFSPINLLLNAIPAILSFRLIGKWFTTYSCLMIALTSVLTDLIPPLTLTNDVLLVCIFGGIIQGLAISLCLMGRATSGGTDFIAAAISERLKTDAWNYVFGFNCVMLTVAGFLFGWDKALYSIIFQFVSTQVIHALHKRYQRHTLWIITEHPEEIYQMILSDPANYLKYYIGYVEFLELKKDWISEKGEEFSQKEFHEAVLKVGPAPFDIVEDYMWEM